MEMTTDTPRIADLATEIFLLGLGVRRREGNGDLDFGPLHKGALELFEGLELDAREARKDPEDVSAVKYALAAFVDEMVLSSGWPGREEWADEPLQLLFFDTSLAGAGFFDRLDELRARDGTSPEVLEVYYLCLALGFRGKYGVEGAERLEALVKVLRDELERSLPSGPTEISPHWKVAEEAEPEADRLPRWLVYTSLAVVAVCVLVYLGLLVDVRLAAVDLVGASRC
jgi:type VI secretion system protein ImpK